MSDPYYGTSDAAALALLGVFYLVLFLLSIAGYVVGAFFLMKVFDKAGVQGKWRAWVPVYNYMVFGKLGDVSPWVILGAFVLVLIPFLNYITWIALLVVLVMAAYRVGLKFGKPWPWLLLFLLNGLGVLIWLGILAFGSARWNPAIAPAAWRTSFFGDDTVWQGIPVQPGAKPAGGQAGTAPGAYPPPPAGYTPPAPGGTTPPPPAPGGTTPPPPAPGGPTEPPAAPEPPRS